MSIKEVPMFTADEKPINLNDVLYTAEWSSGYNYERKGKVTIEAHRVISVDNSRRHFRTRCMNGCETEYQFSKGCSRQKLWGSFEAAKNAAREMIDQDLTNISEKAIRLKATREHCTEQIGLLKTLKSPRIPKAVSTSKV